MIGKWNCRELFKRDSFVDSFKFNIPNLVWVQNNGLTSLKLFITRVYYAQYACTYIRMYWKIIIPMFFELLRQIDKQQLN